jgi:hypothetical protein
MQLRQSMLVAVAATLVASGAAAQPAPATGGPGYRPLARFDVEGVHVELPVSLRSRIESVEDFPVDRYGTQSDNEFVWSPEARIGATISGRVSQMPVGYHLEYEHDLATGTTVGEPDYDGERLPNGELSHAELRKAFLRLDLGEHFVAAGGYMMSHWGLGMVSNDGAHGWTPGSAYFGDPRSGDRVLRGYFGTQPLSDYGLVFRVAGDQVIDDDSLLDGDDAWQVIFSARAGVGQSKYGGVYIVYRNQDGEADSTSQRGFDALVVDIAGGMDHDLGEAGTFRLQGEVAFISGDTSFGPTPEMPKHDLLQIGAVVRAALDRDDHGVIAEFLVATGDQNFDDDEQNAFRMDPNFEAGLLLFRHVIAAQTGRAPVTAGDPTIVGRPVPDLDRIPTGGSVSNTFAFFPRAWWRPLQQLEVYGGPLFAWSDVKYADPFNTRVEGGGHPRNALAGDPTGFYGAELDLGARWRTLLFDTELTLGLEGGMLLPGGAFDDIDGAPMDEIFGGRMMVDYRF